MRARAPERLDRRQPFAVRQIQGCQSTQPAERLDRRQTFATRQIQGRKSHKAPQWFETPEELRRSLGFVFPLPPFILHLQLGLAKSQYLQPRERPEFLRQFRHRQVAQVQYLRPRFAGFADTADGFDVGFFGGHFGFRSSPGSASRSPLCYTNPARKAAASCEFVGGFSFPTRILFLPASTASPCKRARFGNAKATCRCGSGNETGFVGVIVEVASPTG